MWYIFCRRGSSQVGSVCKKMFSIILQRRVKQTFFLLTFVHKRIAWSSAALLTFRQHCWGHDRLVGTNFTGIVNGQNWPSLLAVWAPNNTCTSTDNWSVQCEPMRCRLIVHHTHQLSLRVIQLCKNWEHSSSFISIQYYNSVPQLLMYQVPNIMQLLCLCPVIFGHLQYLWMNHNPLF